MTRKKPDILECGKQTYTDPQHAELVIKMMRKEQRKGGFLMSYKCPHCDGYHIGHPIRYRPT